MKSLLINPFQKTIKEVDSDNHKVAQALMDSLTPYRDILPSGDMIISDSREVLDTSHNCYGAAIAGTVVFGFSLIVPGHGDTLKTPADIGAAWIETASEAREAIQNTYF